MKSAARHLMKAHPVIKFIFYLHLLGIAIWGPLTSVILITVTCFIVLALYPGEKGVIANPYLALLYCTVAVLIVLPGGTRGEITYAAVLSLRILNVMLISAVLGIMTTHMDILLLSKILRLPDKAIVVIIAAGSFLPLAIQSFNLVIFAQRSRGLEFGFLSLFRPAAYRSLIIPYVVCILQNALYKWISVNLRSLSECQITNLKLTGFEVIVFLFSFALWIKWYHSP